MLEIFAENLHYLGDTEPARQRDLCVHGRVTVRTDKFSLEGEDEWCAGASAMRFMRSVCENHFSGAEEHMIPCCGHFMIPSDDGTTVSIIGCQSGIDFDVIHEGDSVIIKTEDGNAYSAASAEYKSAVMSFAKQIEEFMHASLARIFDDDFEKQCFLAFTNEWFSLKEKIKKTSCDELKDEEISFADYISISEDDISGVSKNGISLKSGGFINFRECAYNYRKMHGGERNCIGRCDAGTLTLTFYTSVIATDIHFFSKSRPRFLLKNSSRICFSDLQKQISSFGYTMLEG